MDLPKTLKSLVVLNENSVALMEIGPNGRLGLNVRYLVDLVNDSEKDHATILLLYSGVKIVPEALGNLQNASKKIVPLMENGLVGENGANVAKVAEAMELKLVHENAPNLNTEEDLVLEFERKLNNAVYLNVLSMENF